MSIIPMAQLFVDRNEEPRFLEERFNSTGSELIVIYGRRTIGKTELVTRHVKGKPAECFLADGRPERTLLLKLRARTTQVLQDELSY